MRTAPGAAQAVASQAASAALALATVAVAGGNDLLLVAALSAFFLALGLWGYHRRSPFLFAAGPGGQMAWSIVTLSMNAISAPLLWALLLVHLGLLLIGTRGMWLRAHLPNVAGPLNRRAARLALRNMVTVAEWLGASAAVSAAFLLAAPLLAVNGGSIALLTLLAVAALLSFTLLATRLGGISTGGKKDQ